MAQDTAPHPDAPPGRPAPGRLGLVQSFVNSVDLESGQDAWRDPSALATWLHRSGVIAGGAALSDADLAAARRCREALRALLLVNNGAPPDEAAARELEVCSMRGGLRARIGADGTSWLEPLGEGIDGALAQLLAIVHDAAVDGTWQRLKACRNDTCGWAFYDSSKNRSGSWCSMRVCGSRMKSRAYRRRSRQSPGSDRDRRS